MGTQDKFNGIMNELANDGLYKEICKKYSSTKYLSDELHQEFFIVILEYNQEKIIEIYEKNQLRYFCVGIIRRMATSSTSPYYKKIRKPLMDISNGDNNELNLTETPNESDEYRDKLIREENILEKIKTILSAEEKKRPKFWYNKTLFEMYHYQGMSYRDIEKETKIPHVSVFHSVKSVMTLLQDALGDEIIDYKQ